MKLKLHFSGQWISTVLLLVSISLTTLAQTRRLTGMVADIAGKPLVGATVQIPTTQQATITNENGAFTLSDVPTGLQTLQVSYVGYESREIQLKPTQNNVRIVLTETSGNLNEVIVTGVFDARKRMDASVAITTLNARQIERIVPTSAADLLKNVPGVFVNSSMGEIRNSVASRGITIGTQDGSFGYEYVSMQEDGLPVTNTTYFNYGPDYFLRPDATLGRLEAVRGGTASITAANAPGGIFNYVSKTGGDHFEGEVRAKYGLVGNGKNNYYRVDADFGGPLTSGWTYNIGGFYRYDEGGRYAGYPMNVGGQIKANLVKTYKQGSIKIFGKYLDDRNDYMQLTPTIDYDHPQPAPGFDITSSVKPPAFNYASADFINGGLLPFNPKNLIRSQYRSIGATWQHRFENGWSLSNAARLMWNSTFHNTSGFVATGSATDPVTYALLGGLGVGTYSYKNVRTGQEMMNVTATLQESVPVYTVNQNNLPGQQVQANGIFMVPLNYYDNRVNEVVDQLVLTKQLDRMSFTAGGYFGYSNVHRYSGLNGVALTTLENRPDLLTLTFTGGTLAGTVGVHQLTNADGVAQATGDNGTFISFNAKQRQLALFLGHTWQLTPKLTFDWGLRYENANVSGYNVRAYIKAGVQGGLDGNPLTVYDNNTLDKTTRVDFDKTLSTLSFSAALNYKINDHLAVYTRYSQGKKSPDLDIYFATNRPETIDFLNPMQRTTEQIEMGLKVNTTRMSLFVTPFYSLLSGVPFQQFLQAKEGGFYVTPAIYGKYSTPGVEIEANYKLSNHLSIRGVATFQKSKIVNFEAWVANAPGPEDDTRISYSGNETDNVPRAIINITPTYTAGKFYGFLSWQYLGKRQANVANVFYLPAFSQFDAGAGYQLSSRMQLSLNANNLLNTYGAMSWNRPGGILANIEGIAGFSQTQYEAARKANAPYGTVSIQPRACYVTASYHF